MNSFNVSATYYKYNSGRADNGNYSLSYSFETIEEARELYLNMKSHLKDYEWLYENYCIDGYLIAVHGIYQITRVRVE